jgi:hypothetical protein
VPTRTSIIRTLSIKPRRNVGEIWEEAEKKLGAKRTHFLLVIGGSRYLPESGELTDPKQLFEVRWRGRGGTPGDLDDEYVDVELGTDCMG